MRATVFHAGLLLFSTSVAAVAACDWDAVDPRLGEGGTQAAGGTGGTGTGAGGGEMGGGGSGAGGAVVLDCGAVDVAADDFEDPERDPDKWRSAANYGGSNEELGGQLVMNLGNDASAYAYYETWGYMNLVGRSIAVEVLQVFSTTPNATMDFEAALDGGNKLILRYAADGTLEGLKVVEGQAAKLFDITYDATAHRWWRLRVTEDAAIWEASPDNSDYTKLAEEPLTHLFVPDNVRIRLETDNNTEMIGDQVIWDNVTAEGPGTGDWCDIETFTESFDDPLTRDWADASRDGGATALITDGVLYLNPHDAEDSDVYHRTSRLFQMAGQAVSVEMIEAAAAPSETLFRVANSDEWVDFLVRGDPEMDADPTVPVLQARYNAGTVTDLITTPYDPAQHRWLRIRDDGSTLYWESSADGIDWDVVASQAPVPVELSNMRLVIGVDGKPETPIQGQAVFDNVNLSPE